MTEKTVQLVRSQPRKPGRMPLLPQPRHGLKRLLWSPAVILAGVTFLLGAAIAITGWVLVTASNCCLEWLDNEGGS